MNYPTYTALLGSIDHWEKLLTGEHTRAGPENCPLCARFHPGIAGSLNSDDADRCCQGCPVFARTGEEYCKSTPYEEYIHSTSVDLTPIIKEELTFLKSLLPSEIPNEQPRMARVRATASAAGPYAVITPELAVEYSYTPGDPGRTSGPPEDCYPPTDPELEIVAVWLILPGPTDDVEIPWPDTGPAFDWLEAEVYSYIEQEQSE